MKRVFRKDVFKNAQENLFAGEHKRERKMDFFFFLHKYYVGQNNGSNFFVNQPFLAYSRLIFFHFHNKAFQSLQGHVIKKLQLSIGCRFLISIQKTDEHSTHQEVRRGGRTPKRFLTENLCPSLVNESFEDKEPTT